ncbi:MAG: hypothetical protein AAFY48_17870, partial [Bacteroidota bacterium]
DAAFDIVEFIDHRNLTVRHNLKKLETLFKEIEYTVRYEKGSFNSGYCIVEDRKIAVINKFYDVEGRINVLLEILSSIPVEEARLEEGTQKFYKQLLKFLAREEEE